MMKKQIIPKTDSSLYFKVLSIAALLIFLPALVLPVKGQLSAWELPGYKERVNVFSLGLGKTTERETYLSWSTYSGTSVSFEEDNWKCYSPGKLFGYGRTHSSILYSSLRNPIGGGNTLYLEVECFYSRAWHALHTESSDLLLGPSAMFKLGGIYSGSNSNNVATGEGYLSIGICADYAWRFNIGGKPLAFQASFFSPLAGIAPSPNYDQPYWYVYKYNQYASMIHFAWIGNYLALTQQAAIVCPLSKGSLRVGCTYDYLGNELGGHLTRISDISFTIGYVYRWERKD